MIETIKPGRPGRPSYRDRLREYREERKLRKLSKRTGIPKNVLEEAARRLSEFAKYAGVDASKFNKK